MHAKLIGAAWVLAAASLFAAEPESGYRLVLRSDGGALPRVVALDEFDEDRPLWDSDPLSSGWILRIGDTTISPADGDWVRTEGGSDREIVVRYANRTYDFEQRATLSSDGSHVRLTAVFRNNSTESVEVEPALLLDSSLGERTGLPFRLPDGTYIRNETELSDGDRPPWIKTIRDTDSPSLTMILEGEVSDPPESVVVANWLRLKQDALAIEVEEGRNFDYLPFSENDSAVLIRYEGDTLASGAQMERTIVLGLDEFEPAEDTYAAPLRAPVDPSVENSRLREYTVRQRLRELGSLLSDIDRLLEDESLMTGESVVEVEGRLAELSQRRAEYENL